MVNTKYRLEHDLIGERRILADAYYGIHTLRASENFSITGSSIQIYPGLIDGMAFVKEAAAIANNDLGLLDSKKSQAIIKACQEIRQGKYHDQFIVDVIQGGAGTSTNMNANEVIANVALEILGYDKGDYINLSPLDHVNLSQSTNDAYPTAIKVALRFEIDSLLGALDVLCNSFAKKSSEFATVLKVGRTQLQDAVPMTLGQEFGSFYTMISKDKERLARAATAIQAVNLGGTAIGTGINCPPEYSQKACAELSRLTGYDFARAENLIEATQGTSAFVELSSALKATAIQLSKICNDLKLLSSGPSAGLCEINLPAVQAGSSIMPGKVNPVIPEVVNQIAFEVIGNDTTVSFASEAGQLQLNAFEPIIAHSLLSSLIHLRQGCLTLAKNCVNGITVNQKVLDENVSKSIGIATALNPYLGYAKASAVAARVKEEKRAAAEIVVEMGLMTRKELGEILTPENLTKPNLRWSYCIHDHHVSQGP